MSYTVVPTVATGDVWTASNHNLYIRDNFRAVIPDVVTTKGDLIIGSGADALARLPVGSDGQIFHGDVSWGSARDLLQFCSSAVGSTDIFSSSGSGNYHVPTLNDVPEGANWIYCKISMLSDVSTAYFALYPSYDTTIEAMRVNAYADVYSQCHGIMPLDSTGGLFYITSDTAIDASLYVFAWMY